MIYEGGVPRMGLVLLLKKKKKTRVLMLYLFSPILPPSNIVKGKCFK